MVHSYSSRKSWLLICLLLSVSLFLLSLLLLFSSQWYIAIRGEILAVSVSPFSVTLFLLLFSSQWCAGRDRKKSTNKTFNTNNKATICK